MPLMNFSKGAAMFDATPIENMFLLEYLPSAPEGFLRVYLYARMVCLHPELGESIADFANALHIDEETVFSAMSYWEQQGLVERTGDHPLTYEIKPLYGGTAQANSMDRDYYRNRDFNAELQALFGDKVLRGKEYSKAYDWLNSFGMEQDAVLCILRFELDQRGGKSPDAVFKRAEKRIVDLADRGIRKAEDVERVIAADAHVVGLARTVLSRITTRKEPTEYELDDVRRWLQEWGFSDENVFAACKESTKAANPSIAYIGKILENWHGRRGVHFEAVKALLGDLGAGGRPTPDVMQLYEGWLASGFEPKAITAAAVWNARIGKRSIAKLDELLRQWKAAGILTASAAEAYIAAHRADAAKPNGGTAARPGAAKTAEPKFNYQQHSYTEADFGDDFYYDPMKKYGEGEKK